MKSEVHVHEHVTVIELSGKVMGGPDATLFHGLVQENLGRGSRDFVIDLEHVDWVNSVGLGMLIAAQLTVQRAGGRIVLANVTNIESLLTITRLITVVETFDSQDQALAALQSGCKVI
ncbi:MAG: STAS domain-containing protein [Candidatus Zixiibacteriota bacterium]|nr:MAG: STAS domain-containing protein [candidate division Zixibacteria bacterium]